jgi:hypothetical protein
VLRKISGTRREEVNGGWRKLHNEFQNIINVKMKRGIKCSINGKHKIHA